MALHSYILLFLLLLPLFSLKTSCQNVSVGIILSLLNNHSSLLSPSGDFAFGFRALDTDPTVFFLAVYYYKINSKTVIWTANGDNPVSNKSKAWLTSDGKLTLLDSNQRIWSSNVGGASYGSMGDDGNFILYSNGSSAVWQTFDSPTDTILPGQILKQNTSIFSKLADDDYSKGRFKFIMQLDGNLVLYQVDFSTQTDEDNAFYSTATWDNPGNTSLVFNQTGSLYVLFTNGSRVEVLPEPVLTGDYYQRATLGADGGFRQYTFPKTQPSTGSWSVAANLVHDLCDFVFHFGSGICGLNSYCTQYANGSTNCQCPPHYIFIDPTKKYKGCKPDYIPQPCEQGSEASFAFETIKNLDWPLSDIEKLTPVNETQCQHECLIDCFCTVAIYNNAGTCWKKKIPLSNGKSNPNVDRVAYIKYNKLKLNNNGSSYINNNGSSNVNNNGSGNSKSWVIIVSSTLGGSVVLIGACFCIYFKRKHENNPPKARSIVSISATCSFTYKELEQATNGFSEELGKGAFGVVYKGVMPSQSGSSNNNSLIVAVKKLEESLLQEG